MQRTSLLFAIAAACLVWSCRPVGPNYHRPDAPTATAWKTEAPWREAAPSDQIAKGEWWGVFGDAELSTLEMQALAANQTLKGAMARLEQARAQARISISALFPQASVVPSIQRQREAGNRPFATSANAGSISSNIFSIPFSVTWEPDIFGRIRRNIEASQASYQAAGADLANLRLSVTAELAADYFNARQLDTQIGVLNRTVQSFEKGLQLVQSREQGGVASGLDVAQEQALLDTTRTQAILLKQQRAQFENAIATLTGQPAPNFKLPSAEIATKPPAVPLGVPSDLLERRPDIAEAERQMAAANAQIGVAQAAYYPSFPLTVSGGLESAAVSKLASSSSTFWAAGVSAIEDIFTGGARRAQVQFNEAGYQDTVANYRQTVLTAMQEVEDAVAGLAVIDEAEKTQAAAVTDSRKALEIATNRYTGGLVSYLDVVSAQQTLLSNENLAAQLNGQRLVTSVLLVKALGGGWDSSSIAALKVKVSNKQALSP